MNNPPGNGETPPAPVLNLPRARIEIILTQDGQVQMSGPQDKLLAWGMLRAAELIVQQMQPAGNQILPATFYRRG